MSAYSVIGPCVKDLFEKISAAPGFSGKAGLHLVGAAVDPSAARMPLPAVAIVFGEMMPTEPAGHMASTSRTFKLSYSVRLFMPNVSQADLVANQLPLIEQLVRAVQGTDAPNSGKWACEGCVCELINTDRLCYEFKFEAVSSI